MIVSADELVPGQDVAWVGAASNRFLYGRVARLRGVNEAEIEVSASETAVVPLSRLRVILSVADANQREERRREEETMRAQRAREADQALFDDFREGPAGASGGVGGANGSDGDGDNGSSMTVAERRVEEQSRAEPIERIEYRPPDASWEEKERALLNNLKKRDESMKDRSVQHCHLFSFDSAVIARALSFVSPFAVLCVMAIIQ
jgi:hypothetical protein